MKEGKAWCLRLVLLVFVFVAYYCSNALFQSYVGTSTHLNSSKTLCGDWVTQKKWESLNLNIGRRTQLFLKLDDFFWREHLSKLALPYGIKDSELLLTKVLAVTASYEMPDNIEKLECRTCAVIGNGFAIKNSSLGSVINKYDVVIRSGKAFGSHRLKCGWVTLVKSECWTLTFCRRLQRTCFRFLCTPKMPVHPTTGILAVFVALNYCDVVHIAGFGYPKSNTQRQPIHYYGRDTMKSMKNSYHDLNHEAEALKRLEDSGAILYLHPHS
ncbi:CMP-N-acetylneuraminate-beta-galactosamide-alpha-2,3-sialyltransferase 4 isoform X2 [Solea solea]|uniref:CMP-N-acetylneuraminate-beta-galactosamide- alpha-2,3-sialyltransferase 4 isoform X2 n=1 Tax=Solea solea TaxID=90069 RepID=UPI00272D38F3|nr:CMP-N-acetylneuraminate-beta-galactosamide-alpha-2,3-sialyltransferase 4 isoform X2 [Solea solea]